MATETTTTTTDEGAKGSWNATAEKVLSGFAAAITKGADALRTLAVKERDAMVSLGRTIGQAHDALTTLKVDEEHIRQHIIDLCGISPRTGEPYQWTRLASMMAAAAIIDKVDEETRPLIGVDTALALKRIDGTADTDEMLSFLKDRIASGESLAPRPMREAVDKYLIDEGYKDVPTDKARVKKAVKKFSGSETHRAYWTSVDAFIAAVPGLSTLLAFEPKDAENVTDKERETMAVQGAVKTAFADVVADSLAVAFLVAQGESPKSVDVKTAEQLVAGRPKDETKGDNDA